MWFQYSIRQNVIIIFINEAVSMFCGTKSVNRYVSRITSR
jgi:hypothetical protein